MATAWDILVSNSNSTVPAGSTAWTYINNSLIIYGELEVVVDSTIDVLLEPSLPELYVFLASDIEVLIEETDNFATTTDLLIETTNG